MNRHAPVGVRLSAGARRVVCSLGRRVAIVLGLAVVVGVAIVFGPAVGTSSPAWSQTSPANATSRSDGAALTIDAGYSGVYQSAAPIPVRVTVTADRLLRGTLTVETTGSVPVSVPLDVAGGSRKRLLVVLPASDTSGTLTVRATVEGTALASQTDLNTRDEAELVGLMPGLVTRRPLPAPARLAVDAGAARFSALTDAEMARSPYAIEALGTIATTTEDLVQLGTRERDGLARWVTTGGHLLVAEERGANVAGLPELLQPGPSGRSVVGLGQVVAAGRSLGAGSWDGVVEPTASSARQGTFGFGRGGPRLGLGDELAGDTGFRIPRLRWLAPFLGVYVPASAGFAYALLRRRRLAPVAWVIVPTVAIVLAVTVGVVARKVRSQITPAHATVLATTPFGTEALSFVGIARGDPGTARVTFPQGWSAEAVPFDVASLGGGTFVAAAAKARESAGRLESSVDVGAGGFGVVGGRGAVATRGSIEIEAAAEADDRVVGTVHNTTPWRLENVAVFVDTGSTAVGTLEPGATQSFTVFVADFNGSDRATGLEVWPVPGRFGAGTASTPVNFPMWWAWASPRVGEMLTPGRALAVGWTRAPSPPVDLGRPVVVRGRAAVISAGSIAGDRLRPAHVSVRRTIVRTGLSGAGGIARYDLPAGSSPTNLYAHVPTGARVEVWSRGSWTQIGAPSTNESGFASSFLTWEDLAIPSEAVQQDRLFLRVSGSLVASPGVTAVALVTVGGKEPVAPAPDPSGVSGVSGVSGSADGATP